MDCRRCLVVLLLVMPAGAQPCWLELRNVPPGLRPVYSGGSLVRTELAAETLVFATKGNRTTEFYSYNPTLQAWTPRAPIPLGNEAKSVDDGGCMAFDGQGRIYAVKGNYSFGFYRYSIQGDSWQQMADIPAGPRGTKVQGGTDLVFVPAGSGSGSLYLLKGYYNEFYIYDIDAGTWAMLPPAPVGVNERWPDGSWLVYDGDRTIFAHKAYYHEFWTFNTQTRTWDVTQRYGMPFIGRAGVRAKAGDGSCAAWLDGTIFALKGYSTLEFWGYNAARDSWFELDSVPPIGSTGRRVKVRNGADIVVHDGRLYALKGNSCNEFWCYTPGAAGVEEDTTFDASRLTPGATIVRSVLSLRPSSSLLPSGEGKVRGTSMLLDAAGRRVMELLPGPNDVRRLAPGVYFVRSEPQAASFKPQAVRRVVVTR
ncbi:hypothetical protein FJY69_06190 [candidate division WOR-3 bacterium]|nr:hypothetical protein [candidate division WOR-3 bacterium]